MQRPHELTRDALLEIVDALQQALYLDVDGESGGFTWNPAKEWSAADALMELSDVLARHGLAPEASHSLCPRTPGDFLTP